MIRASAGRFFFTDNQLIHPPAQPRELSVIDRNPL